MHKTLTADGETEVLAGSPASPSGPPLGPTVVPFPFPRRNAALVGRESEAGEPLDEDVFDLGSLAVKIVLRSKYPRCTVFVRGDEREENSSPL